MPSYQLYNLVAQSMSVLFVFAFGACVGSLTNVLVYRLPLGMSAVTPPSRCPACSTKLTWRENIPIFGWLFLRGRCRFCKSSISPEYPLVEAFVALLFAAFFVIYYTIPADAQWLGIAWGQISPEWARADSFDTWPRTTWPIFIVLLVLLGALTAMTIVDAKTFTIPLELPWFATATALLFHVGYAAYLTWTGGSLARTAPGTAWSIPLPGWSPSGLVRPGPASWWLGATFAATVGLIISNFLLYLKLIPRSFADYPEWEQSAIAAAAPAAAPLPSDDRASPADSTNATTPAANALASPDADHSAAWRGLRAALLAFGVLVILTGAGKYLGPASGGVAPPWIGFLLGFLSLPLVYAIAVRAMERSPAAPHLPPVPTITHPAGDGTSPSANQPPVDVPITTPRLASAPESLPPDMWIQYPHARREMFKELLFLAPAIGLALIGGWLFELWLAPRPAPPALWIMVLGGVLQGYIIAGAIVWAVRIFGSLGFGKEAMGLGDVHLLAAVGACIGWVDAALAFPLAAVVGLYWVIVSMIRTGGAPRAMPFGPYLAGATMLVLLCKPLLEIGLNYLMATPPGARPINLP